MGVGYLLDHEHGLTLTVFDGVVTGDEWRSTARQIFADPSWPPGRLNVTDLRTADLSAVTRADRDEIYALNAQHAPKLVGMKSATIGGVNFEIAQKFERDDRTSGLRIIPFDDLGRACEWLGVPVPAVAAMIEQVRRQLRSPDAVTDRAEP
jgi:hypothetical protein